MMNPLFLPKDQAPESGNIPVAPQWITAIGTAAVAVFTVLNGQIWWRILSITMVSLGLVTVLYRPVRWRARRWLTERHNARAAARSFDALAEICEHFKGLVDRNGNTGVDRVLRDALGHDIALWSKIGVPSMHWFGVRSEHAQERIETDPRDFAHFVRCYQEFDTLVHEFSDRCVMPIYTQFVGELRTSLKPEGRASLETFRERYLHFYREYENLIRKFSKQFRAPNVFYVSAFRPDPISV